MLTLLTVERKAHKEHKSGIVRLLPVNSLKVEILRNEQLSIRHLKYISRNGNIEWKRISRQAREGRTALVYSENTPIPQGTGIRLFVPAKLRQRLCGNMALQTLEIMREVPNALRIGVYDPEGDSVDLAEYLLKYTGNLLVVTQNYEIYQAQAQKLLTETGAVLCISRHPSALSTCGLIISPSDLNVHFTPMHKSVVLTSQLPSLPVSCRVYYKYSFSLPPKWETLRPKGVEAEFFAGGLYSLCGIHQLGSTVPLVCSGEADTQTTLSLRRYFEECFGT